MRVILISTAAFCYIATFSHAVCRNGIKEQGVSLQEQKFIVNRHNEIRQMIMNGTLEDQPRGINLKPLNWDDTLAKEAQDITNTCEYGHKPVINKQWPLYPPYEKNVGQNIGQQTVTFLGADWEARINAWFREHGNYTYSKIGSSPPGTGHYTQIVWAETTNIGCGYTSYKYKEDPTHVYYKKFYVCNYGPAGNVRGQFPYQEDK